MATEHVCIASPAIRKLQPQHTLLTREVAKKSKQPCPAQKETQRNEEGCQSPQGVSRMVIVTEIGVCRPQGLRSCWTTPTPQTYACVLAQRDYTGIPGIPLLITPRDERHLGVPPLGMDGEWAPTVCHTHTCMHMHTCAHRYTHRGWALIRLLLKKFFLWK